MDHVLESGRLSTGSDTALSVPALLHACRHANSETVCANCQVRSLAVCAALAPDELSELDAITRRTSLDAKTTFVDEGSPASSVFTITSGVARLYRLLPDGRRQVLGFALPGDFLGLTIQGRNSFSVDAVIDVEMCRIDRNAFDALVAQKPNLLARLRDIATHELVIAHEQMLVIGRRSAKARVAAFLISLRERWGRVSGASVTVPLPMPRLDIADYLGLTIETVSRVFTQLQKDRAILNVPDGIRVLDAARLAEAAEG